MKDLRFVYVTVGNFDEASLIAKKIVEDKLAACANLLPQMTSFYFWEGKLQEDREVVLIFKTNESKLESLIRQIKELHSYEVPCIVSLPIDSGNPDYLDWVRNSL
ncbi:divalent-cation tolerance protein CutA [Leptospira ilyithenensis]|uniref:Divalent-cation tolerance protein CutA n=1 Tax=Leptospira ilyithenensis TaxID=2484901 RepID=A0A4R9LS53_9LEPT|nr:divalent-cation tolerance protein CutA [Leptospira ilyithenensis]TGN14124.1 divalent-cation tolerance protein CutA [Leptospira ilyithenensis]